MKILAFDASSLVASVAVLEDDIVIAEYTTNFKKTHSQTLLPMLAELKQMIQLDLKEIDALAVSGGPGSFTGLRIGSATVKGLGLALDKPIISVPTVDAMAYGMFGSRAWICPMMDARRNQVYTGLYSFEQEDMTIHIPQCACSIEEIIEKINKINQEVVYLGDGVPVQKETIQKLTKVPYFFAPAHLNRQRAASVGALAYEYYKEGKVQSALEHEPEYLRLSQAERERLEHETGKK